MRVATDLSGETTDATDNKPAVAGNLLRLLPFLGLFYVQLVHHLPWRDELNAWGLVLASHSWHELLANVHYEGHPLLWYALLYSLSKVTRALWMMKLLQGCIGTAIYLAFALRTPLRPVEQVLFYCSYYVLFEYTVMSRMYGLSLLLLVLYLWSRLNYPHRFVWKALLLGLIANVDVTSMILSGGLFLEYAVDFMKENGVPGARFRDLTRVGIVYGVCVAISAITLWPARDISVRTTGRIFAFAHDNVNLCLSAFSYLGLAFLPIRAGFPHVFWTAEARFLPKLYFAIAMVTVPLLFLIFRSWPRVLSMVAVTIVVGIAFGHFIFLGSTRHFGIAWLAFIAGLWMLRFRRQAVSKFAYLLLGMGALAGLAAAYGQWARPFADDYAAAQWLTDKHLQQAVLIGTPDTHVIGVPEKLARPIYLLDCACIDTYMKFSARRDTFDPAQEIPARLVTAVHTLHAPEMIFLINRAFSVGEEKQLNRDAIDTKLLAQFTTGDVDDEHFFLYKVSSRPDISPSRDTPVGYLTGGANDRGGKSAEGSKESRVVHAE